MLQFKGLSSSCAMPFIAGPSLGTVTTSDGWGLCPELETISVWLWGYWLRCRALIKCRLGSVLWLRCESVLSSRISLPKAQAKIEGETKRKGKKWWRKAAGKKQVGVYLMHCLDGRCGSRSICQLLHTGQFGFVSGVSTCSMAVV